MPAWDVEKKFEVVIILVLYVENTHTFPEENQVYTGDLTYHEQTVRLIKFYLMKNMKGNRANWLAQFPFCDRFPHVTVFCSSASFPNNLNYCCQQMQGAFKMCSYYHFNP